MQLTNTDHILANALLKSMKLAYNVKVHSLLCFKFCLKKKIMSEICRSFLDLSCLLRRCESAAKAILFNVALMRIVLITVFIIQLFVSVRSTF